MKIRKLRCENFRRFKDFSIDFDEYLTVLVARNGSGKSSILDALAISLGAFLTRMPGVTGISQKDTDFKVLEDGGKPPYSRITCETIDGVVWDRTERRDKTAKTNRQVPVARGLKSINEYADGLVDSFNDGDKVILPVLAYYGTGRGVFSVPERKRGFQKEFTRFDSYAASLESKTNFRRFIEYFYSLESLEGSRQRELKSFEYECPELKAVRVAVQKFMPEFSNPRIAYPAGIMVDWKREDGAYPLRIEQLSDGYRIALVMVMDIAARMAEANPDLKDPLISPGIVMVDEVELHLHPGWQQTVLPDLRRVFPEVQFIVSTHSPHVIATVRPDQLRVIDWDVFDAHLVPVEFSEGAENSYVLDRILGVSPRPERLDIVRKLKEYQLLVEKGRWSEQQARKLKLELDAWGKGFDPEIERLEMDIAIQELDAKN
ncbi:MAG: AAA family ATPase [Pseudomonas sp.]|nr:AAA family ATPase [Pseudomonas sp.]